MDFKKIGKYIAENRVKNGYTQESLAEALDVSNRAISKWERGLCLPDSTHMVELCKTLNISINDLFNGEKINSKDKSEVSERNLLELIKAKEEKDKQLLRLELVIGYISTISFFIFIFIASYVEMAVWLKVFLIIIGIIILLFGGYNATKIEQTAGYYKCAKCGHKHIPTYKSVFLAQHIGRTRYLRCPKCGKKSWQKKVL